MSRTAGRWNTGTGRRSPLVNRSHKFCHTELDGFFTNFTETRVTTDGTFSVYYKERACDFRLFYFLASFTQCSLALRFICDDCDCVSHQGCLRKRAVIKPAKYPVIIIIISTLAHLKRKLSRGISRRSPSFKLIAMVLSWRDLFHRTDVFVRYWQYSERAGLQVGHVLGIFALGMKTRNAVLLLESQTFIQSSFVAQRSWGAKRLV